MSESKLKAQEVSCQAAVSSTVKRTELDENRMSASIFEI